MFAETIPYTLSEKLKDFTNEFLSQPDRAAIIKKYRDDLDHISPVEAARIFNLLALLNDSFETIKNNIDKFTSIVYKPLRKNYHSKKHLNFYDRLHKENAQLLKIIEQSRPLVKKFLQSNNRQSSSITTEIFILLDNIKKQTSFNKKDKKALVHLLEKVLPSYVHYFRIEKLFYDDLTQLLIDCEHLLKTNPDDNTLLNRLVGKLYFRIHLTIYREELILFPLGKQFIHERIIQF